MLSMSMSSVSPDAPIRVKFLSKSQSADRNYERWLRRLPGGCNRWQRCEFIFEQDCRDYDWLVVYDDLPRHPGQSKPLWEEVLSCPRERTLLVTTEPASIKLYGFGFLRQFGWILTSQEERFIRHPGMIQRQPGLIWFYGETDARGTFDHLASISEPPMKSADLSTVCSAKRMRHTFHAKRFAFTQALKAALPQMEVFGRGVREIADKADALDRFRCHVAIENHVGRHHWTEKLTDPFLAWCLPIYHGCPDAASYFPEESFIPVDIHDFGGTVERISRVLRDNEYQRRLPAITEARRLALHEYATFPQIARLVAERHHGVLPPPVPADRILSRHLWRRRHPIAALSHHALKLTLQVGQRFHFPSRTNSPSSSKI